MCWIKTKKALKTHLFSKIFRFLHRSKMGVICMQSRKQSGFVAIHAPGHMMFGLYTYICTKKKQT